MKSRARILGHPVHPMLVSFPVVFYISTFGSLIAYTVTGDRFWFRVAAYANAAGVITALLAAIPGAIDAWLGIPKRTAARDTVVIHAAVNATALLFFCLSLSQVWPQRLSRDPIAALSTILSAVGTLLTLVAGSLGWTLVQKHHVGVAERSPPSPPPIPRRTEPSRHGVAEAHGPINPPREPRKTSGEGSSAFL